MAGRSTVENVDVTLTATDDASKVVDAVAKKVDGIDDKEIVVTADDQATPDLEKVDTAADEAARQRELIIRSAGLGDVLDDIRNVQSEAADAAASVESIGPAAEEAGGATVDGMGRAANSLQGLPGPIGEVAGMFGQAADAVDGVAGKVSGGFAEAIRGIGPLLGVAGGAALTFWNLWSAQADAAKKKLEEVKQAQLDLASGDVLSTTKLLTDQYTQYSDALNKAGISMDTYTQIVTGKLTLDQAISEGLANQNAGLFVQGAVLDKNNAAWQTANDQLVTTQTRQFEAAKAIGATTSQMLDLASTSLAPVRNQILEYVAAVNGIPETQLTSILTDADPDDVAQVKKVLDELAKPRDQKTTAEADTGAAEQQLNYTARPRTATITINAQGGVGNVQYGPPAPRMVGVGARTVDGVEPFAATVPFPTVAAPMAPTGGGGTSVVYNTFVTVPVGTPTADVGRFVAAALDRHERNVGARRRARS
jgi:hypothetical protein